MLEDSAIDRLYGEAKSVLDILHEIHEASLEAAASNHFRKALLLAVASYFEHRASEHVLGFVYEFSEKSPLIGQLVKNKAVSRQYHTWFDWKENNANQFFGLFGSDFKKAMVENVKQSDELKASIQAFMEIGRMRNCLVHQDYATFSMDKTLDEIYDLYKCALSFVESLPTIFRKASTG